MSLQRFKDAQEAVFAGYATALEEMKHGQKASHWIWYVFPQLTGLGQSATAREYAIRDLEEAMTYLQDDVLRPRLIEITVAVSAAISRHIRLVDLMNGTTDALKIVSSLTLFDRAAQKLIERPSASEVGHALEVFRRAADQILSAAAAEGFGRCRFTLDRT